MSMCVIAVTWVPKSLFKPSLLKGNRLANRKYSIDFQAHNQAPMTSRRGVFYKLTSPPSRVLGTNRLVTSASEWCERHEWIRTSNIQHRTSNLNPEPRTLTPSYKGLLFVSGLFLRYDHLHERTLLLPGVAQGTDADELMELIRFDAA